MSIKVKSFYSSKGGVGKTTLSLNYASYSKEVLGKKVLYVDLDPQKSGEMFCQNMGIEYSTEIPSAKPDVDVMVIDYPPAATLEHKPLGEVVMISNPSFLSAVAMLNTAKEFEKATFLINRFHSNRKDDREIVKKFEEMDELSNVFTLKEYAAVQRAENKIKPIFSLTEEEAKDIYNFDKARQDILDLFEKL